jgi:ketosteroid isomerase-like protein
MSTAYRTNDPDAEAEIRELFETRTRALAGKDAATLAAANDAAVVVFDAVAPFVHRGAETTARKQEWLAAYRTGIGHEIRDLEITADADLAFCHFLVRISGPCSTTPKSACGYARPAVSANATTAGRSSTSTPQCPSTPRPAKQW